MASRRLFDGAQIELGLLPIAGGAPPASETGSLSQTLDAATLAASGTVTAGNSGSVSSVLAALTASASGSVANGPSGSVSASLGSLTCASLRQGLVGAWCPSLGASGYRLIDRSGYGNHGTLTNMDPGTDWVPSGGKLALDFDGVDDNVNAGTGFKLVDLTSKTISAWINKAGSSQKGIVDKEFDNAGGNYGGWGFWTQTNNKLWWWNHANKDIKDNGPNSISLNQWNHVSIAWDSAQNSASFFINGIKNSTISDSTIVEKPSGNAQLLIGSMRNNLATFQFDGQIDDVRIYNRALTPQEILLLYTGGRGVGLAPERIKHRRQATAGITGDLSKTLAALTASASGSVANGPSGSVSQTLSSLSLSSQGTVADGASATLNSNLAAATLSSDGTVANGLSGSLSSTLAAATLSASGNVAAGASGSLSVTLNDATLSSTGNVGSGTFGSVSQTLASATLSSDGSVAAGVSGSVSQTLAAATLSSSGTVAAGVSGSVSAQLGSLTCSSAGFLTAGLNGAVDAALGSLSLASSGSVAAGNTGSATVQLASAVLSASGTVVTPSVGSTLHVRINGVWKATTPFVKVNGVWKQATAYTKVNGVWK